MRIKRRTFILFVVGGIASVGLSLEPPFTQQMKDLDSYIVEKVVDYLWARSDVYWHKGEYEKVVKLNKMIVLLDPSFVEAYLTSSWLLESMGNEKEALQWLLSAETRCPCWEVYQDLGMYYYKRKDYKEAEKHFEKACLQYSPPPYVWRMYAHSLKNQNKSQEAIKVLEEAVRRFPDDLVTKSLLDRFKKEGDKRQ